MKMKYLQRIIGSNQVSLRSQFQVCRQDAELEGVQWVDIIYMMALRGSELWEDALFHPLSDSIDYTVMHDKGKEGRV